MFTITDIPSKGQGLKATEPIPRGTRILSEKPRTITAEGRPNETIQLGIEKNAQHGTFEDNHFMNHSCLPNAMRSWNEKTGEMNVHATRDIEKDEEITDSYVGPLPYYERCQQLKETWGFQCYCDLCTDESKRKESDSNFRDIRKLQDQLGVMNDFKNPEESLGLALLLFKLIEEEGWKYSALGADTILVAYDCAAALKNPARAKEYAEMAVEIAVVCEGDDSLAAEKTRKFLSRYL